MVIAGHMDTAWAWDTAAKPAPTKPKATKRTQPGQTSWAAAPPTKDGNTTTLDRGGGVSAQLLMILNVHYAPQLLPHTPVAHPLPHFTTMLSRTLVLRTTTLPPTPQSLPSTPMLHASQSAQQRARHIPPLHQRSLTSKNCQRHKPALGTSSQDSPTA